MSKIAAIVHRYPDREMEIHRLCLGDEEFLGACEDFADASAALDHWQSKGISGAPRADEYRALVEELAAVVLTALDAQRSGKHGTHG